MMLSRLLAILLVTLHSAHANQGRRLAALQEDVDALSLLLKEPSSLEWTQAKAAQEKATMKSADGKLERARAEMPAVDLSDFIAAGANAPVFGTQDPGTCAKLYFFDADNAAEKIAQAAAEAADFGRMAGVANTPRLMGHGVASDLSVGFINGAGVRPDKVNREGVAMYKEIWPVPSAITPKFTYVILMTRAIDRNFGEWAAALPTGEPAARRVSMANLLNVGNQVLRVLFNAHNVVHGDRAFGEEIAALHVFHGDLQYHNVLVEPGGDGRPGRAMVIDWGAYGEVMRRTEAESRQRTVQHFQMNDVGFFTMLFEKYPAVRDCEPPRLPGRLHTLTTPPTRSQILPFAHYCRVGWSSASPWCRLPW